MKAHDIEFLVNSGDNKGKKYKYTLAKKDGEKQWSVTPLFQPPPSIFKEKIEMVLVCQDENIPYSGAVENKIVNKILEQLRNIALEITPATLNGLDKQERLVQIDQDGYSVISISTEQNREPEYFVKLTCWGLYDTT